MTDVPLSRSEGLALHLLAAAGRADDLAAALDGLDTPALCWKRHMPGLVNPGPSVALLDYAQPLEAAVEAAEDDLDRLEGLVERSGSFALAGDRLIFTQGMDPAPIRYWYCMRRRRDFSHDDYLVRYRDVHSRFGLETAAIEGYTQWHASIEAGAAACDRLSLAACGYDSISVLDIADLDAFFVAAMSSDLGERAVADEERFVDRGSSHDHVFELVTGP